MDHKIAWDIFKAWLDGNQLQAMGMLRRLSPIQAAWAVSQIFSVMNKEARARFTALLEETESEGWDWLD